MFKSLNKDEDHKTRRKRRLKEKSFKYINKGNAKAAVQKKR